MFRRHIWHTVHHQPHHDAVVVVLLIVVVETCPQHTHYPNPSARTRCETFMFCLLHEQPTIAITTKLRHGDILILMSGYNFCLVHAGQQADDDDLLPDR